jgi:Carboxypeptidase regulatory-like domain
LHRICRIDNPDSHEVTKMPDAADAAVLRFRSFWSGIAGAFQFLVVFPVVFLAASLTTAHAQSTFGSILGTVTDSTGAVVSGASVSLTNAGTSAVRTTTTDAAGGYSFVNLEAGNYVVTVAGNGFKKATFSDLSLAAREAKRVDASLNAGSTAETVVVQATSAGVITTDVSSLSVTKTGAELNDLPVAIFSRSSGSTSPISTLTTEPGVQTDDSGDLAVEGTTPALMSFTIDGISSVDVENSGPINELFPSFNSISEIRVSETNNNAEFSGVADVTTTSMSGTNAFHGGVFENHENAALNAGNPFATSKPKLIMNDFGGFLGGPLGIPGLYDGHNRTFFFLSYEGLRLPHDTPIVTSVPSLAMRSGNICDYLNGQDPGMGVTNVYQPDGVTPIPCASVPVSAGSANFMQYLMPMPNTGPADAYANNYSINFPSPISSNQADLRIDHALNTKHSVFARLTWKNRQVTTAPVVDCPSFCYNAGTTATGPFQQPETDQGLTAAWNYVISTSLVNEVRAGFNSTDTATRMAGTTQQYLSELGITVPQVDPVVEVPNTTIVGFMPTGGAEPSAQRSNIMQLLDNITWSQGQHTYKFGGDVRRMTDHDDNVFGNYVSGQYAFDSSSDIGQAIDGYDSAGNSVSAPFAQFLLGYPDYTAAAVVQAPAMNGLGYAYAFYGQDDWKVTPSLTLNYGLRYELHPPLWDVDYNTAAFLPTYNQNGVQGAVVVPNQKALNNTAPAFAQSIAPTPILTAAQAGIPAYLRYTDKTDFGPRIGFAWRPFHNDRTVLRGGWGRFTESPLGWSLVSGWAVNASYLGFYSNDYDTNGNPLYSWSTPFPSNLAQPGSATFEYAFPIHYRDPSVQQWNLTAEQDLGHNIGFRLSYVGSHGSNLETEEDLNQVPANTAGYAVAGNNRPFPNFGLIQSVVNAAISNYNSMTAVVERRMTNGLQFQVSYMWTRDLSNEGGDNPTSFAAAGGNMVTDRFHTGLDYGNVIYDRRNRVLGTYLYELPFGPGKPFLNSNSIARSLAGGWQWGGVLVLQTGPFLTPYEESTDPGGTNVLSTVGYTRADIVPGVPLYTKRGTSESGVPLFLNPNAFAIPGNNIGRFGNAGVGNVVGPGTQDVSMSLIRSFHIHEKTNFQFGAEASNLFNHRNYEPPNMETDDQGFGTITGLQTAEGAGPRSLEITGRISF